MQLLGPTIEHIAAEKAGIFKRGVPVVTIKQEPSAMGVLQKCFQAIGDALYGDLI